MQVIQCVSFPQNCYFFTRWGRIDTKGQTGCLGPHPIKTAINLYESKYSDKYNKEHFREENSNTEI